MPHRPAVAAGGGAPPATVAVDLRAAAAALYDDLRLSGILGRLLDHSGRLLGVACGSVSLVDVAQARYAKAAERGAACRLGHSFPLDEGITGRVAAGRGPVVLRRYSDLRTGHLPADHPAARGAVAAVPIWWRGEVLGVNVAFAGRDRRFSAAEVDHLEVLSQIGAAGIASAAADDPSLPVRADQPPTTDRSPGLSPREHEVLGLLARGLTDRQVAEALVLARKTVEKHVGAVLRKTGTTSRTAAVVRALEQGWLPGVGRPSAR